MQQAHFLVGALFAGLIVFLLWCGYALGQLEVMRNCEDLAAMRLNGSIYACTRLDAPPCLRCRKAAVTFTGRA